MDTNLASYIKKYDRWLGEKTISHSSRVIPVKESLDNVKNVRCIYPKEYDTCRAMDLVRTNTGCELNSRSLLT